MVAPAAQRVLDAMKLHADRTAPFRAIVTAVTGELVTIIRQGATTADAEPYARLGREFIAEDDEVLAINLGQKPIVLGRIGRSDDTSPTFTKFAAAGSTGTLANSTGTDDAGLIKLVPGGSGVTSGDLLYVTFGTPRPSAHFAVMLQPFSAAASALGAVVRPVSRASVSFVITSDDPVISGSTYQWLYTVTQYA